MSAEFSRRDFLRATTAATAAAAGGLAPARNATTSSRSQRELAPLGLIDTNVMLSRWPGRRLPLDETPALAARLRSCGVTQAWAGSFDSLLHKDISGANARLVEECRKHGKGLLVPFGSVNPSLPDWEEELCHCHEKHKMPGLRLHPNYHNYKLDSVSFERLLKLASERKLILQIALTMEDERSQHSLLRVPHVDAAPLVHLLQSAPCSIVLLNWWRALKPDLIKKLADTGRVLFDIATVENVGGLELLLQRVPGKQVVFGSYAPFYYFESAYLKLRESILAPQDVEGLRRGNAQRLLGSLIN